MSARTHAHACTHQHHTHTHTQVTAWNKRCEQLTSLSLKDVQGKPMSELVPPEYVQVLYIDIYLYIYISVYLYI